MKNEKITRNHRRQIKLPQIISLCLLAWLMSFGFAFGQTQDERKLELVVQTGHSEWVRVVAFSPDGNILAAGDDEGHIKLWDVKSGNELRTMKGDEMYITSISFSPDGKFLASSGLGNTSAGNKIKIWNVENGNEVATLKGHSTVITKVAFSPNGKSLASSSLDLTIKIWDLENYKEIKTLTGHSRLAEYEVGVMTIAFIPNKNQIASGAGDKTIKIWDLETGSVLRTLVDHTKTVTSLVVTPDGKRLISGSDDKTIKIWDLNTGKLLKSLSKYAQSIQMSPNGEFFASSGDFKLILWDTNTFDEIRTIGIGSNSIESASISSDNRTIATSNVYSSIDLWDAETGDLIKTFSGYFDYILSVKSNSSGEFIAWSGKNHGLNLLDLRNNERLILEKDSDEEEFSPDGRTLAYIKDSTLKILSLEDKKINKQVYIPNIRAFAFFQDNQTIACLAYNGVVKLFSINDLKESKTIKLDNDQTSKVSVSPDGNLLAVESEKKIIIYNLFSNLEVVLPTEEYIESFAFTINSDVLLVGTDTRINFWDLKNKKVIKSLERNNLNSIIQVLNDYPKFFEHYFPFNCFLGNYILIIKDGNVFQLFEKKQISELFENKKPKEILTITTLNESDVVINTFDGRFDASEGAQKLMHYAYGLEVINLEQLKEMYYEPGLLQKLLGFSKEPLRTIVPLKDIKLYPEIVGQTFDEKTGKLNIKLKNRGGGIGRTEVFVNDKRVVEDARDEKLRKNPNIALDAEVSLTVDLPAAAFVKGVSNEIKVITSNYLKEIGKGNIQSRGTAVFYLDKNKAETDLPNLYAIVGGVSDYDGDQLDLNFAAKDAEDFSNALRLGANRLFCPSQTADCLNKINITTLSTARENPQQQPTKDNFKKAFAEIAKQAKPEDILVVYLSGHGVTLGTGTDTYFYLTREARSASREDLAKTFQTAAISNEELTDWLTPNDKNPNDIWVNTGKQVIILDTCAAGNFAENDWKKDKDGLTGDQIRAMDFLSGKTGTFILMGSSANRPSYEANRYNQGLLTFALLEGMKGSALQNGQYIDVGLLFDYATKRVPTLAKEMSLDQNPIIKRPSGNPFVFGQMTEFETAKIELPKLKPMLLRPLLTNPETGDDDLNFIPALRKMLDAESSYEVMKRSGKGDPVLIYVDDDSFPGAVRVTGTYTVEGEKVRVKAFLRRDGNTIATLKEIIAPKDKILEELLTVVRAELSKM